MSASAIKLILRPILPRGVRVIDVYAACHQLSQATQIKQGKLLRLFTEITHISRTSRIPEVCRSLLLFYRACLQYHLVSRNRKRARPRVKEREIRAYRKISQLAKSRFRITLFKRLTPQFGYLTRYLDALN